MASLAIKCTGCFTCMNSCPKDAVMMRFDKKGFYKANINEDKCVDCKICEKICPQLNLIATQNYTESKTYAVMAENYIREKCSSGGVFYLIGRYIIQSGGVVYGAKFDNNNILKHDKATNEEELLQLCKSKYVQSYIERDIVHDIKTNLAKKRKVLFVGVPCQVAGIQKIIGENENLMTIDLVCSGSQPPKYFKKYLNETEKRYGKNINAIDFRDKRQGWKCGDITIKFTDSTEIVIQNDIWFKGFLSHLYMSDACKECKYSTFPRLGDISIGDFWNIEKLRPDLNDHMGTSLLCINSPKAEKIAEIVNRYAVIYEPIDFEFTKHSNWFTNGRATHPKQAEFYMRLENMSFSESVNETLGYKYDCGIVGCFTNGNYGAALTYYALYKVIKNMSLKALMIEKTNEEPFPPLDKPIAFKENPYDKEDIASLFADIADMRKLNDLCKSFVVGSDQLWNWNLFGHSWKVWTLEFADENKNKIAYATSFGEKKSTVPNDMKNAFEENLRRFTHISVRESSGVTICKDIFGIDAIKVLDPVYICDKNEYIKLANKADYHYDREPYIFCYIILPSDFKITIINAVAKELSLKVVIVPDALGVERWDKWKNEFDFISYGKVEDWLSLLINSSYVVADSFHAYSLSLIFNKQVISIAYGEKCERMKSIQREVGLPATIDSEYPMPDLENIIEEKYIDYKIVNRKIEVLKTESINWLRNALDLNN